MLSDEWLPRYRLLKNFTMKWNGNWNGNGNGNAHGNGNGNAYDRGDYNSSFALRAVELKIKHTYEKIEFNPNLTFYPFGKMYDGQKLSVRMLAASRHIMLSKLI